MSRKFALGLDFGTESARALLVDVTSGREIATAVCQYPHGHNGVILTDDPNLARQHPQDYLTCAETIIRQTLRAARRAARSFRPAHVIGIGVAATGSTPIPVDRDGWPLAFQRRFRGNPAAQARLWKDHTAIDEAAAITQLAREVRPHYLAKCGGAYSSEWFFSKVLHCLRTRRDVFDAAYLWVEAADWIPAVLTDTQSPEQLSIGVCAAGHKAMYNATWGGYPDAEFLGMLDPALAELRTRLKPTAHTIDRPAGRLCEQWARKVGLPAGTPVAVGAIDAHLGAVGAGIAPGTLVKIIGTSTCDMLVAPADRPPPDVPGLCGIVNGSIIPDCIGLEAGQAAVGDLFNWFVNCIRPGGPKAGPHEALTAAASKIKPGASGLLALDWNNGNRNILADQRLSGLLVGQSLYTTPAEIYRALIEATAFGAMTIINRLEEYGLEVREVVNCGGIAEKNRLAMQIYADVLGRPMKVSRSQQTCALGAAIAGAVVAGRGAGGYDTVPEAQRAMTGLKRTVYQPDPDAHGVYQRLYGLYRALHDGFGAPAWQGSLFGVMKKLLEIRAATRA